jgi:hypothetical protein
MDANSGEPWCEMEIADLAYSMACDGTTRRSSCAGTKMRSGRRRRSSGGRESAGSNPSQRPQE